MLIRAFVYPNRDEENGKVMVVENTMEGLLSEICLQFKMNREEIKLILSNGCEINDVRAIRDDEKIFITNINSTAPNSINVNAQNLNVEAVSDWISLNVGGKHFITSRSTLSAKEPLSMLARMFAEENNVYLMNPSAKDSTGAYLIDRSPEYFAPILNYLRHGIVILDTNINPKGVLEEAVYYGIF